MMPYDQEDDKEQFKVPSSLFEEVPSAVYSPAALGAPSAVQPPGQNITNAPSPTGQVPAPPNPTGAKINPVVSPAALAPAVKAAPEGPQAVPQASPFSAAPGTEAPSKLPVTPPQPVDKHEAWQKGMDTLNARINGANPSENPLLYKSLLEARETLQAQQPHGLGNRFGVALLQNLGAQFAPESARIRQAGDAERNREHEQALNRPGTQAEQTARTRLLNAQAGAAENKDQSWKMLQGEENVRTDQNGNRQRLWMNEANSTPMWVPEGQSPVAQPARPEAGGGAPAPIPTGQQGPIKYAYGKPVIPPKPTGDELKMQYDAAAERKLAGTATPQDEALIQSNAGVFSSIAPVGLDPKAEAGFSKQLANISKRVPSAIREQLAPPEYNSHDTRAEYEKKIADYRADASGLAQAYHMEQAADRAAAAANRSRETMNDKETDRLYNWGKAKDAEGKEIRLNLDNAPDEFLVDQKTGNPIPMKMVNTMKPSMQESNRADFAKSTVHGLDVLDRLKAEGKLPNGPLEGLTQKALAGFGLGNADAQDVLNLISFNQTSLTGAHVGGRFNQEILKKMSGMVDLTMNTDQLLGAENAIREIMEPYAVNGGRYSVAEWKSMGTEEQKRLMGVSTGHGASAAAPHSFTYNGRSFTNMPADVYARFKKANPGYKEK